jgi:Caspase domain
VTAGSSVENWALVIGIDKYWSDEAALQGGVSDALRMREWLLDGAGGGVPAEHLVLVLAPRDDDPPNVPFVEATKDKIMIAINDLLSMSGGKGERLYFFYAGHGLTARVDNRDENALVASDFNAVNTDNSIALRSLWEFFETTQFRDQFFFVDACRNIPWENREFEIGRWTLPRARDPGLDPVQQFILYATSPGLTAAESGDFGNEQGAFTGALLYGLAGTDFAKAWSWERSCYEVRWERLADYVKRKVESEKHPTDGAQGAPLIQVPQDAGSRGVAGRDRDPVVASFPAERFEKVVLEVELEPDDVYEIGRVRVLDGIGDTVEDVEAKTGGRPVRFELDPRTYALRAVAEGYEEGRTEQPVDLYASDKRKISLRSHDAAADAATPATADAAAPAPSSTPAEQESFGAVPLPPPGVKPPPGHVVAEAADRLAFVEVRDNTGAVVAEALHRIDQDLDPGFYQLRVVAPGAVGKPLSIALAPGEQEVPPSLEPPPLPDDVRPLAKAAGAKIGRDGVVTLNGEKLIAPRRTTMLALAAAAAHHGDPSGAWLGLDLPKPKGGSVPPYIVVLLDGPDVERTTVRVWPGGDPVPRKTHSLRPVAESVASMVAPVADDGGHWLSIEPGDDAPMVFALTLLHGMPSLVVAHLEQERTRIFQFLLTGKLDVLRIAEQAQRLVLNGRLAAIESVARQLADSAADDPLAACLAGYSLLRLGHAEDAGKVADAVIAVAPTIADGYVLRGEAAAAAGNDARSRQAFTDAIAAGVPLFGEGLTRLMEGLRASNVGHPRAAIVRHVFQRHLRGTMWSVFVPRPRDGKRRLEPGRLLITGADTGFEA